METLLFTMLCLQEGIARLSSDDRIQRRGCSDAISVRSAKQKACAAAACPDPASTAAGAATCMHARALTEGLTQQEKQTPQETRLSTAKDTYSWLMTLLAC